MKKVLNVFMALLATTSMVYLTSCDDDTNIGGGGSVPVADGYYITQAGVNPVATSQLKPEVVETDGFGTKARAGFLANYVYLTAGNYNVVSVIDQEIAATIGGPVVASPTDGSDCSLGEYILVEEFATDGAAIVIANEGLYKVGFDNTLKEIWFARIQKVHVIGGATTFGWSQNDLGELAVQGGATAAAMQFKRTNVEMKKGDWKVRFNCRWSVDRRIEPGAGFADANGYVAFTNIGGALNNTAPGGANFSIPFGQDGKYTIQVDWTPANGFVVTTTNTEPIAPKAPNSYAWGIIGSATTGDGTGWGADIDLPLQGGSTATSATYEVTSVQLFNAVGGDEFKFRANDDWGIVLKPGIDILGTVTGDSNFESTGGGDPSWRVKTGGDGNYKITISTTNTGEKWNITFVKL